MGKKVIYLASSERGLAHLLEYVLFSKGEYVIKTFSSNKELINNIFKNPDIVIMDEDFDNGKEAFKELQKLCQSVPVIMLSGKNEIKKEVLYTKNGVYKNIQKSDYFFDKLVDTVDLVLDCPTVNV
jgi:DNA-binding NtrC family response regulator